MTDVLTRALRREDLTETEALALLERVPLCDLAAAADEVRRATMAAAAADNGSGESSENGSEEGSSNDFAGGPDVVTWQIDRNVNITNVCISGCKFCNFHCRPSPKGASRTGKQSRAYVLGVDECVPLVEETLALGGDQLLLQGGLHPGLKIDFYVDLFEGLKRRFPTLRLNALGAPEVSHIARISGLTTLETLERLRAAGLDSLPGAGAEILVDEVRRRISPAKPTADEWLAVMREAHAMNLPTTATMMYGHIETPRHIVQHLLKIRDLQAQKPAGTHGFVAFIPWIFRSAGTALEREMAADEAREREIAAAKPVIQSEHSDDGYVLRSPQSPRLVAADPLGYLRVIAVSRLVLNNIRNIQASWLTVGAATAQMALHSGANDFGSIMIEERVVSSAGASERFDAAGIRSAIRAAGFTPVLRDQLYRRRAAPNF